MENYTYKHILLGLRKEYLENNEKLDKLREYVYFTKDKKSNYYFNMISNSKNKTEMVVDRDNIRESIFRKYGYNRVPTRAFMRMYEIELNCLLRKKSFKKKDFNMNIIEGKEREFQELIKEILNSDFAINMFLTDIIKSKSYLDEDLKNAILQPNVCNYIFTLRTDKSEFEYEGRKDIIEFSSVSKMNEKFKPLTQEHIDVITNIEFPKESFSSYHQNVIEKNLDARPIVLSEDYIPSIGATFEIKEEPKKLVLINKK
ncbi:MAG: hypothetical protein IJD92_04605 [Bacilli bacterium]|nr:hypothetical protein [Bacilli bacterium]